MPTTMTIRLEDEVRDRLDRLAEAIRAFVETNEWQIGEIHAALREADAGDFASDKDVAALSRKWNVNAGWQKRKNEQAALPPGKVGAAAFAAGLRILIAAFDKQTRPDQTI